MKEAEFIAQFIEGRQGTHVNTGRFDCGVTAGSLFLRDKVTNQVSEFQRPGLKIVTEESVSRLYYGLVAGLLLLTVTFSAMFTLKIVELDRSEFQAYLLFAVLLAIYLSPFAIRLVLSGYKVVVLYFSLCAAFALVAGSWERYVPAEGFAALLAIGILPYLGSRLFRNIWTETHIDIRGKNGGATLGCSQTAARKLMRALKNG